MVFLGEDDEFGAGVLGGAVAPNLLIDGDMEAAGVAAWTSINAAVLSKETVLPYSGSQFLRVVTTAGYGFAGQNVLTVGRSYRITGWTRCLVSVSVIYLGGTFVTLGVSAIWQPVVLTAVAGDDSVQLGTNGGAGIAVDFDDMRVVEI